MIGAMLAIAGLAGGARAADAEPPRLEFAFEEIVQLSPATRAWATAYGERLFIPITGGTLEGPGIKGTIIPGGWDWQLRRADGCTGREG